MESLLEHLNLENSQARGYDPHKVISKQRLENKNLSYDCTPKPEWEKIENKESWEEFEEPQNTSLESNEPKKI